MSRKRNVAYLKIAYNHYNSRTAMQTELRFLSELNLILQHNTRFHDHGIEPVIPNVTEHNDEYYGCNIHLKFPVRPKGDSYGQFSYPGLHALLVSLSELYTKYKQAFRRMEFHLDVDSIKTPWVILSSSTSVLVNPKVAYKSYSNDFAPSRIDGVHSYATAIEQMMVFGETQAVARFDRAWRRQVGNGSRQLYWDTVPKHNVQIFVLERLPNGTHRIVPVLHRDNKNASTELYYTELTSHLMVSEPLWFTNTIKREDGSHTNVLYPEMGLMDIGLEETQVVA